MGIPSNPPVDQTPWTNGSTPNGKSSEADQTPWTNGSTFNGKSPEVLSSACPFISGFTHNPKDPIASKPLEEFAKILQDNKILASTGCTAQFCQAGRATSRAR